MTSHTCGKGCGPRTHVDMSHLINQNPNLAAIDPPHPRALDLEQARRIMDEARRLADTLRGLGYFVNVERQRAWSNPTHGGDWPSDDDRPPDILNQIDDALALIPTKDLSRPANPDQPWPYTSF